MKNVFATEDTEDKEKNRFVIILSVNAASSVAGS